jgi:chromosome partitioning protein
MVITITNQKGGVGKTSVSFHLGGALAAEGRQVVLIDADPAGGLSYAAGFTLKEIPSEVSTAVLFRGGKPPMQALARGLQLVLSSPAAMIDLEEEWSQDRRVHIERSWVAGLGEYVLIDSPPNLGRLSVAALAVADAVLIPFIPEDASLGPLDLLLDTIKAVNPGAEILGAVPSLSDARRNMTTEVADAIRNRYGLRILTSIPRHLSIASTPRYAKPVLEYAAKSSAAEAFRALAKEIMQTHVPA